MPVIKSNRKSTVSQQLSAAAPPVAAAASGGGSVLGAALLKKIAGSPKDKKEPLSKSVTDGLKKKKSVSLIKKLAGGL